MVATAVVGHWQGMVMIRGVAVVRLVRMLVGCFVLLAVVVSMVVAASEVVVVGGNVPMMCCSSSLVHVASESRQQHTNAVSSLLSIGCKQTVVVKKA